MKYHFIFEGTYMLVFNILTYKLKVIQYKNAVKTITCILQGLKLLNALSRDVHRGNKLPAITLHKKPL